VDRLIESGRTIGITRRIITRSSGSPVTIIVWSNLSRGEDILTGCDRGITPGCQVFCVSKGFGAWRRPHPGINPQALKLLC